MSNFYIAEFRTGDPVYYTGEKLKHVLASKEGKPHRGWIYAPVQNEPGVFVVWFPDTKESDSYVIKAENLTRARPPKMDKQTGPVIEHMPVRQRSSED